MGNIGEFARHMSLYRKKRHGQKVNYMDIKILNA